MPMTARDIIGMIEGGGVCHRRGGSVMENSNDNFHMIFWEIPHKPA